MPAALETIGTEPGWATLFWEAFRRSKNAMMLLDGARRHVEVNDAYLALLGYRRSELLGRPAYELVAGGPLVTQGEWVELLRRDHFSGTAELVRADTRKVAVQFAGHPEIVTGRQLVLFVAIRIVGPGRPERDITPPRSDCVTLSPRELEVINLLTLGLTGPDIARELQLAHNTIRTHVRNAMAKTGAHSRAQLVAKSLGDGLAWHDAG